MKIQFPYGKNHLEYDFNDVKILIDSLKRLEPCTTAGKAMDDTEHNSPFKKTVDGMLSPDYKERFKAEYQQTKIRYEKLKAFNNRIDAAMRTSYKGSLGVEMPKHDCPEDLLHEQHSIMGQYLHILEVRAVIEGIDLVIEGHTK